MDTKLTRYLALLRPNARRRFEYVLRDWLNFLGDRYGISDLEVWKKATTDDAFDFLSVLRNRGGIASRANPKDKRASVRTVNNAYRCIKGMTEMFLTEGCLDRNIFKTKLIKLEHESSRPKRETLAIPDRLIKPILGHGNPSINRDQTQCLMALLLAGALRINEALALKIGDYFIDSKGFPYLQLQDTKAGDTLDHPFGKWAESYLKKQIATRREEGATLADNLFVSRLKNGRKALDRLPERTATRYIKKIFVHYGIPNCSAHSFRKTHADALVSAGVNVEKIRQALRHNDIRTTQGYFSRFSAKESALNKISWL